MFTRFAGLGKKLEPVDVIQVRESIAGCRLLIIFFLIFPRREALA